MHNPGGCFKTSSLLCSFFVSAELLYKLLLQTVAELYNSESLSWAPTESFLRERGKPTIEENFRKSVIQFLHTGRDWPVGEVDQNPVLAEATENFTPELGTRAFILTPQNQADEAVDEGEDADGHVQYIDGLLYENLVGELISSVNQMLPGVQVTPFAYQALDMNNELLDLTGRGKALFQYDPNSSRGRRGSRLIFQGIDIRITEPRRMTFPKGMVYGDSWIAGQEIANPGENRILSDIPDQHGLPSTCGGQIYESSNYTCYGDQLCPILDGVPTLLCGADCFLESLYTCWDSFLCPVIDGVATLRCGEDCYLPKQYKYVHSYS